MIFIATCGTAACRGWATIRYLVIPSDPAAQALHTPETRELNNPDLASPYPPGAVVLPRRTAIRESALTLKVAFVLCELGIVFLLLDLLRNHGQGAHLVLVYAWNPLLAIEVAGSGHIDIVGALLVVVSAAALARRWRTIAAVGLGLAVAVKFLPIVLLPLYWKRIRIRDAVTGAAVVGLLYLPFLNHGRIPIGSLGTYVQTFRFNGPVFAALVHIASPQLLAALAAAVGIGTAIWMRGRAVQWSATICLAHGRHPLVRARGIPLVSSVATSISDIGINAADSCVDGEHYPDVYSVASAETGASVGSTAGLDHAGGIRMPGNCCGYSGCAPDDRTQRRSNETRFVNSRQRSGPRQLKPSIPFGPNPICIQKHCGFIQERIR